MLKAIGKNVILEFPNQEKQSDFVENELGMYVPNENKNPDVKNVFAKVISVGSKVTEISEGDEVLVSKVFGVNVEYEGSTYKIIEEINLMAKKDRQCEKG